MPTDHIRYDILAQEALRGMVRQVLSDVAKKGLPGDHHFFITFDTQADGVRLSARAREQYPEEMTIVLQHQFWDLKVTDETFEVGLSFGGVAEKLLVPFDAIKAFVDPSIQFALQFEAIAEPSDEGAPAPDTSDTDPAAGRKSAAPKGKPRPPARHEPVRSTPAEDETPPANAPPSADKRGPGKPDSDKPGGEVVRLDRFRKK
jgi:hypothetical protein